MKMMQIEAAQKYILSKLEQELAPNLYYHGIHHTLDVVNVALQIAEEENVKDSEFLALLKTAATYHDSGFLMAYSGHEAEGCGIVRDVLPGFGYSQGHIEIICGMIMSTKVPQSAATDLEKILCDADLDYLGRDDFKSIGETLYAELSARSLIGNRQDWNQLQIRFLESHQYHTKRSRLLREPQKQAHLNELRETV